MNREPRSRLDDPTVERNADPSTEAASGLTTGRPNSDVKAPERDVVDGPGVERNKAMDETAVRRTPQGRDRTPRRYEQSADEDPVMPAEDPSLGTKI